ncbi:hypothetical protein CAOG_08983 [Capsaspora owczarzaki ATCC 30864]|uniref:hypothetical protein n=2 Tax=Capsaspora owczarzaki (strain ATCC 30864) TaxID=595528 RepID=UPI0003524D3A|nr:hypothetical protein CAOG_08983 [Capsaspora owczarzaki ATCC 30864]|eukprot:XP_011270661.1 hypothetical protein CAOG_08983 [Capsaspora owczarzaki ATCC 30864]
MARSTRASSPPSSSVKRVTRGNVSPPSPPKPTVIKPSREVIRSNVLELHKAGLSYRQIADQLGLLWHTVRAIHVRYSARGGTQDSPRSGRPTKVSSTAAVNIVQQIKTGDSHTATEVAATMRKWKHCDVTADTIRNGLRREEDWLNVVFSDETALYLYRNNNSGRVWRVWGAPLDDRSVQGTVKFGGGHINVWGAISRYGISFFSELGDRMNGDVYLSFLNERLKDSLAAWGNDPNLIFMQDNAPCHKRKDVMKWFKNQNLTLLEWPANSPDLNPIEHAWNMVKNAVYKQREITNQDMLWERFQEVYHKVLTVEVCTSLISSMPRRIKAVLDAQGGYTKY